MADIDISIYDNISLSESISVSCTLAGVSVYNSIVVQEVVTPCRVYNVSKYETVTCTDAGIDFNYHISFDPREDFWPRIPTRELKSSLGVLFTSEYLKVPVRTISSKFGSKFTAFIPTRSITSSLVGTDSISINSNLPVRSIYGRAGWQSNFTTIIRSITSSLSEDGVFNLNLSLPVRQINSTLLSDTRLKTISKLPSRSVQSSLYSNWLVNNNKIIQRFITSSLSENIVVTVDEEEFIIPIRSIESSLSGHFFSTNITIPLRLLSSLLHEVSRFDDYVIRYVREE